MIVDAGADIAVVTCGSVRDDPERGLRQALWVLDLEVVYFKPGLWGELAGRLKALARRWGATPRVFAPEHLAPQVSGLGVRASSLPPEFDPELMLTFAAECIGVGLVKFCPAVTAKMKTQDDRRCVGAESWRSGRDGVAGGADRRDFRQAWRQGSAGSPAQAGLNLGGGVGCVRSMSGLTRPSPLLIYLKPLRLFGIF